MVERVSAIDPDLQTTRRDILVLIPIGEQVVPPRWILQQLSE